MSYRYEKRLPGIGPVRRATGLTDATDIRVFEALMLDLARRKPVIVELFRDKHLDALAILRANEEEDLTGLIPDPRTIAPLWAAMDAAWSVSDAGPDTLTRYRTSVRKLQRLSGLSPEARVADLSLVDWKALAGRWGASASDWMAVYRMLSTFLSLHFGAGRTGKAHPFRLATMDRLPRKAELARVPAVTPDIFWRVVDRVPEFVRPAFVVLAGTGLRRGEYFRLERHHLRVETCEIVVPGSKTAASSAVVPVDPSLWPWVEAAVPSPVQYAWLREQWVRACRAEGLSSAGRYDGPRLHDLRHCTAQWAINGGADEAAVQQYLRHTDPKTTRRYSVQTMRAGVSTVVVKQLLRRSA